MLEILSIHNRGFVMSKKFVLLGNYSIREADIVKAILEEADILSYLLGGEEANSGAGIGTVAGVEIQVPEEDLERAKQLLDEAKNAE